MKKKDYLPSVQRLVEIADPLDLSLDDRRHLHRVKNWLRRHEEQVLSSHKVNPGIHTSKARGIAI